MQKTLMPPKSVKSADDFQTPPTALTPLLPYLKKEWLILECAEGKGNLTKALREKGFNVIGTDILTGTDFLIDKIDKFDCIITNPPYSKKEEFITRCYTLGKPFALLMPLTALEGQKRQALYKKYGLQIILLNRRINFETPSGNGSGSWFATSWFTWGLNLPKDIVYSSIPTLSKDKNMGQFYDIHKK